METKDLEKNFDCVLLTYVTYDNIGLVTGFSYNLQEWITPVTGNMKNTTKRLYWVGILEDNNEAASY